MRMKMKKLFSGLGIALIALAPFGGALLAHASGVVISQNTVNNEDGGLNQHAGSSPSEPDNFAFKFAATETGTPTSLTIDTEQVAGNPVYNISIHATQSLSSTQYGSASDVTFTLGSNVIAVSGGSEMTSGNDYYLILSRTSSVGDYIRLYFDESVATGYSGYYSSALNVDPDTLWHAVQVPVMELDGTTAPPPPPPIPSTGIIELPTSTAGTLLANVGSQFAEPGLLEMVCLCAGVPLVFYVMKRIIDVLPGNKK